ncbi:hypothetical protein CASFOL_017789 [Castilleja foliolosa]|uniref:RRM domain-containing protein n=1 Tax=Castilleja foliolosa TaxID=1961234 RepID=A0ABD3D8I4_9LAMI
MTTRITPGVGSNLLGQHATERNQDATVYVGNLEPKASEDILWELFVQAGPVVNVYVPKDRVTSAHQGYGFVEFRSEEDADYAIKVLNMLKLHGKDLRVNKASQDKKSVDVGANLFIGNLDPDVDEKLLYDTFSAFGVIVSNPKMMRDPETGNSRGFGFISYDSFDASDAAIEIVGDTARVMPDDIAEKILGREGLFEVVICSQRSHDDGFNVSRLTVDDEIKDAYIMRNFPAAYEPSSEDESFQATLDYVEEENRASHN